MATVAWCLEWVASAGSVFSPDRAVRLFAAADALRGAINASLPLAERPAYDRALSAVRSTLGEPAFSVAWQIGAALTDVVALAEASAFALPGDVG